MIRRNPLPILVVALLTLCAFASIVLSLKPAYAQTPPPVAPPPAVPAGPRFFQSCEIVGASSQLDGRVSAQGRLGWELVSVMGVTEGGTTVRYVACYKRPG